MFMELKTALKLRNKAKRRKPSFSRQEGYRHVRLRDCWRKPMGKQSKLRKHQKARGSLPMRGYGSPAMARGLTRQGFREVIVHNPAEISRIDARVQAAVISGSVGRLKRSEILKVAKEKGITVLNA